MELFRDSRFFLRVFVLMVIVPPQQTTPGCHEASGYAESSLALAENKEHPEGSRLVTLNGR